MTPTKTDDRKRRDLNWNIIVVLSVAGFLVISQKIKAIDLCASSVDDWKWRE